MEKLSQEGKLTVIKGRGGEYLQMRDPEDNLVSLSQMFSYVEVTNKDPGDS